LTTLTTEHYVCPSCGNEFDEKIVVSFMHKGQDSDFYPHYLGLNPLPYYLVQCSKCSFTAYPEDYSEGQAEKFKIKADKIKKIQSLPLAKKLPENALKFFITAKIYEEVQVNPYKIGNLYLRASWCCRASENRKAEIEMQQLSIKFFKEAVEKTTISNPDNALVVSYLVGELYRRLEDRKLAREWFENVIESIIDPEQQWLLELAKKQAELNEYLLN